MEETEWAGKGFCTTGIGLELKETQPTICFLPSDQNYEFFDSSDTYQNPTFYKKRVLLSNDIIANTSLREFETDFLDKVRELAENNEEWIRQKNELESMLREGKELPKQ